MTEPRHAVTAGVPGADGVEGVVGAIDCVDPGEETSEAWFGIQATKTNPSGR